MICSRDVKRRESQKKYTVKLHKKNFFFSLGSCSQENLLKRIYSVILAQFSLVARSRWIKAKVFVFFLLHTNFYFTKLRMKIPAETKSVLYSFWLRKYSSFSATVLMRMMNKTKKCASPAYDLNRTDDVDSILCKPCCMCTHTASIHTTDDDDSNNDNNNIIITAAILWSTFAFGKRQCERERNRAEWINAKKRHHGSRANTTKATATTTTTNVWLSRSLPCPIAMNSGSNDDVTTIVMTVRARNLTMFYVILNMHIHFLERMLYAYGVSESWLGLVFVCRGYRSIYTIHSRE